MLHFYHTSFSEILVGLLALGALFVVIHLVQLEVYDIRKRRRMAEKGEQFGLIQKLIVVKRALAARAPEVPSAADAEIASGLDSGAKRWASNRPAFNHRWN